MVPPTHTSSMPDKVKVGVRIDKQTWEDFREYVKSNRQRTRGVLGEEVELALQDRMHGGERADALTRIEDDVATLKAVMVDSHTDGGATPAPSQDACTHAHADTTKPRPNSPRSEKVEWIISEYYNPDGGSTTPEAIQSQVQEAFGFGERTAKEYVQLVIDELGAKRHPENNDLLVWGENLERVKEE